jgi:hypothetical protein
MDKQVLRRQDDATRGSEAEDRPESCTDFACTFRITTVAYMDADVGIGPKRPSPFRTANLTRSYAVASGCHQPYLASPTLTGVLLRQ